MSKIFCAIVSPALAIVVWFLFQSVIDAFFLWTGIHAFLDSEEVHSYVRTHQWSIWIAIIAYLICMIGFCWNIAHVLYEICRESRVRGEAHTEVHS